MAQVQSTLRGAALLHHLLNIFSKLPSKSPRRRLIDTSLFSIFFVALIYEVRRRRKLIREKEQGRRREIVRRNSGILRKDGGRVIYVPTSSGSSITAGSGTGARWWWIGKSKSVPGTSAVEEGGKQHLSRVVIYPTKVTTFLSHRRLFLPTSGRGNEPMNYPPPVDTKPGLNLAFLHQFTALWSIMVPRVHSKETFLLSLHTMFLIARTYLSLVVARLDGEIVRDLVAGNGKAFIWGLFKWIGVGIPGVYCNAMIKYLQSKISISFRTRLTRYIHDLYLNDDLPYYKLTNLDGGLQSGGGADQYITSDLTLFCDSAAALYSSLGKPSLDLIVFNYQLARELGILALGAILGNYIATAYLLRKMTPNFARLAERVNRGEGTVRTGHTRLIANSEEIAFYGGSEMEKSILDKSFKELKTLFERIYSLKIRYNMLEDFILKYCWSAAGYIISSIPIFLPTWGGMGGLLELAPSISSQTQNRTKSFITNKRLMLSLADAGGRMMYSFKDLAELAGYTSRVYSLISTLHRVHSNSYDLSSLSLRHSTDAGLPTIEAFSLADVQGTLHKGFDGVRLENVPLVAPALWPMGGELLLEKYLDIVVREGEHLLISGPNGVGKSSVARIVAGLWPVYRGLVSRPRKVGPSSSAPSKMVGRGEGIMFLPQRVYMSVGTLRDQVIYPHTEMDMRQAGMSDGELIQVLETVKLEYLVDREGGLDARKEWKDVLSGGEKQRISIARVVYQSPKFALLDESTSAVSTDVESLLYATMADRGITMITISSRAKLKRYHGYQLTLGTGEDGQGWEFDRIGGERERMGVEREIRELKEKLERMEGLKKRKEEIEKELGSYFFGGRWESGQEGKEEEQDQENVPAAE